MKIISGKLKGRTIVGYEIDGTRPTMDRVKESVFGTIQDSIKDSTVLDLFAGSGNYGIEAYSNGSSKIYLNDANRKCIKAINDTLDKLNIKEYFQTTCMDYMVALKYYKEKNVKFDLVFLDPPYKMVICEKIMMNLVKYNLLNDKALIICEVSESSMSEELMTIKLLKMKKYSDKYVFIYKNNL